MSPGNETAAAPVAQPDRVGYWRANMRLLLTLLPIWFVVSFGLGILLVEPLNETHLAGFPLGFWFAHQGSIYAFIVMIFVYAVQSERIAARYGVG